MNRSELLDVVKLDAAAMKDNGITQAIEVALAAEGRSRDDFFLSYMYAGFEQDKIWKVVDTNTGDMVSVARFSFQREPGEPANITSKNDSEPPSERMQKVMKRLFGVAMEFAKDNYTGRPHASAFGSCPLRIQT